MRAFARSWRSNWLKWQPMAQFWPFQFTPPTAITKPGLKSLTGVKSGEFFARLILDTVLEKWNLFLKFRYGYVNISLVSTSKQLYWQCTSFASASPSFRTLVKLVDPLNVQSSDGVAAANVCAWLFWDDGREIGDHGEIIEVVMHDAAVVVRKALRITAVFLKVILVLCECGENDAILSKFD